MRVRVRLLEDDRPGATRRRRRSALLALALALIFPLTAQSYTLAQLLQLPLERLLELQITSRIVTPYAARWPKPANDLSAERRRYDLERPHSCSAYGPRAAVVRAEGLERRPARIPPQGGGPVQLCGIHRVAVRGGTDVEPVHPGQGPVRRGP